MVAFLDIATVLAVAQPPLFDFLFDLLVDPDCGVVDGLCEFATGECDISFCRNELDALADAWACDENLAWPDRAALLLSLDKLPWHNDRITFYWGECEDAGRAM